jgi:hypothetical protein
VITRSWRFAGLIAVSVASRSVWAQDSLRFVGGDPTTSREVSQIIEAAAVKGLPAGLILSKARFAVAVRTPGPKIVETARAMAARLVVAQEAIAPHALESDLAGAEAALSYDVPPEILRRISLARPKEPIAVPLGVLTQLVADRVPAKRAGEIVTDLLRRGATTTQIAELGNNVDADVKIAGYRAIDAVNVRYNNLAPHLAPMPTSAATTDQGLSASSPSGPKKP